MTSEQQVRAKYKDCEIRILEGCFFIEVKVSKIAYIVGKGTSRYRAFTDAMQKLGMSRVMGSGKYQKYKLQKV